jgi:hypothetical protein
MASIPNDIGHDPPGADDALESASFSTASGPADTAVTFRANGSPRTVVPGALQYSELQPAARTDYAFHAGSWLAGPNGFEYQSEPIVDIDAPPGWDPLTDPWPVPAAAKPERPTTAVVQVVGARHRMVEPVELAYDDLLSAAPEPAVTEPAVIEMAVIQSADIEMVAPQPEPVDHAALQTQPVDLTEWPDWEEAPISPASVLTEPVDLAELFAPEPWDHPSGPLPHMGEWPPTGEVPESPAEMFDPVSVFDVTLTGPLGNVDLGFRDGHWYSICGEQERRVSVGEAMRVHPQLAGQITQLACWWMRQNPMSERSLDLATELSMAIAEQARRTANIPV